MNDRISYKLSIFIIFLKISEHHEKIKGNVLSEFGKKHFNTQNILSGIGLWSMDHKIHKIRHHFFEIYVITFIA